MKMTRAVDACRALALNLGVYTILTDNYRYGLDPFGVEWTSVPNNAAQSYSAQGHGFQIPALSYQTAFEQEQRWAALVSNLPRLFAIVFK